MGLTVLEKLVKDRERIVTNLTWLKKHSASATDLVGVTHYIGVASKAEEETQEVHGRIIACSPDDLDLQNQEYFSLMSAVSDLILDLKRKQAPLLPQPLSTTSSSAPEPSAPVPSASSSKIRLPKIELPSFNGKLSDWTSFKDLFTASVASSTSLTKAQKFTYLASCLKGDAAQLLKSMDATDANYDIAWDLLKNRYQNEREIFFSTLRRFTNQPTLFGESASGLRSMVDVSKECIRAIKNLTTSVDEWDGILVFLLRQKLDPETRKAWELSLKTTSLPVLSEFFEFLEQQARGLAAEKPHKSSSRPAAEQPKKVHAHHANGKCKCDFCSGDHPNHACRKFKSLPVFKRLEEVRRLYLCFKCIESGHLSSNCPIKTGCHECKKGHHSLLHLSSAEMGKTTAVVSNHSNHKAELTPTILATAVVRVPDNYGQFQLCRALLDGGSTSSFISEACVQRLGLKRQRTNAEIVGVGSTAIGQARGVVNMKIRPHFQEMNENTHEVSALVMKKVTGRLPVYPCDSAPWPHLNGLLLADPTYYKPGDVDLLLGADVFWDLLLDGKKKGQSPGLPVGIRSTLGWLVAGNLNSKPATTAVIHFADVTLDERLQKFWELENVPDTRALTKEERECESHFDSTATRDNSGRFIVQFPFKKSEAELGSSREIAVRRLKQLERRLEKNPEHHKEYHKFMEEYESLGHMKKVSEEAQNSNPSCYIPHHFVLKESSTTTKFRVVFDASAKTSSGVSLNDKLMVGPTLQESLVSILMRFRTHVIAFTADIAKMYRQILMSSKDTDMQKIVWRKSPNEPILDYRLLTATYGTASAPYHATKVLQQLAEEEKNSLPMAHAVASQDFYMDDLMSGAPDILSAIKIQKELLELMRRGGFDLRKWSSNSEAILEALPVELRETQLPLRIDLDEVIKTLGLRWNPASDEFSFKVNLPKVTSVITKRNMLSEMAKVFDPLGWLAPAVIRAKIIFQKLWKTDVGWDDPLPHQINEEWLSYRAHLPNIEELKIHRCSMPSGSHNPQLLGFCDASEQAYAAVIYLRVTVPAGEHIISLIAAKTRVAPSKQISLPRLELCGALLLAQLLKAVQEALKIPNLQIRAWTDSTVVLAWLQAAPSRWQTFVANRVTQIQETIPPEFWAHVKGIENPADCASRGIDPADLVAHSLWWKGPRWLQDDEPCPHKSSEVLDENAVSCEERKSVRVHQVAAVPASSLLYDVSTLKKLKRITALCCRFMKNCQAKVDKQKSAANPILSSHGPLSSDELENSLLTWVKIVQLTEFADEIHCLAGGKLVSNKSKLRNLNPFLDSVRVLRVGGRLRHSKLPADQKTPIILPRHHRLTELLIQHEHHENLHAGAQLLLSILLRRFWIVGAKDAIRHQIKKCVTCTRHGQSSNQQFMGDLPEARVTPARAFLKCGVDYAGPFVLRAIPGRTKVTFKAYLSLFVCFTTRALHLEVVSSLETESFLAAFRRFIARRGKPTDVYSDCGTNFNGASRELKEMLDVVRSTAHAERVAAFFANEGVLWHFNPPSAPHFGGLWEAGVKSAKFHLYRVIGVTRLTFEELTTIMCQIEACLNSRPLTPMSTDPNDLAALTPGHFLIGDSLRTIAEPDLSLEKINRLSRWQLAQQLTQQFWNRWSGEFLTRLQQRPKWLQHRTDVRLDDMVVVKDERLPPLQWQLGRVVATHPGPDGHTRVVTVKTAAGEFKRPIVKLCLLPVDPAIRKNEDNILIHDVI